MSREIKKIDILILLLLTALSLADPITDILTLWKFHREGHMRWFFVGLTFLILPCFPFAAISAGTGERSTKRNVFLYVNLCGFHPFSTAVQRLEALIFCSRKKLWHGEAIEGGSHEFELLEASRNSALLEAVFEAAPQFVIQLYVAIVQQEPVSIIQVSSLSLSFLSLVWALKPAYEGEMINKPYKILNSSRHLLLLSARLLAITCFVVAFKWFIIFVYLLHVMIMFGIRCFWLDTDDYGLRWWCELYLFSGLSWIGYDTFDTDGDERENARRHLTIMTVGCLYFLAETWIMAGVSLVRWSAWYAGVLVYCVVFSSSIGFCIRTAALARDWAPMGQGKSTINRVVKGVKWWRLKI